MGVHGRSDGKDIPSESLDIMFVSPSVENKKLKEISWQMVKTLNKVHCDSLSVEILHHLIRLTVTVLILHDRLQ